MADFTPGRNQDAYATFAGFIYQIKLTILRWLELSADEELFLECGEDIDRVSSLVQSSAPHRDLEQVKRRTSPLTLRSPECIAALINFGAHVGTNPNQLITYRFTTTAMGGIQRWKGLPPRTGAIAIC